MELLKLTIYICVLCVCVSLFIVLFSCFYVMPSSECGANLSKTLPKSGIQIGKSDQRHTSAVAKINIQPFFAFTQTLSLNSFIFSTKEGDFQKPIKSVPFSFSLFLCIGHWFYDMCWLFIFYPDVISSLFSGHSSSLDLHGDHLRSCPPHHPHWTHSSSSVLTGRHCSCMMVWHLMTTIDYDK